MQSFKEQQRFNQKVLMGIILALDALCIALIVFLLQQPSEDQNLYAIIGLGIGNIVMFMSSFLFFSMKMTTEIDYQQIAVQISPIHTKPKVFNWSEIEKAYIRKYDPIGEYGGWGLRKSSHGMAFNMYGHMGLQIEFKSGDRLLIGTNKVDELNIFLETIESK